MMLSVGTQKSSIKRNVPTVFDSLSSVGGLTYPAIIVSVIISKILF